jgi:hypothetical protein
MVGEKERKRRRRKRKVGRQDPEDRIGRGARCGEERQWRGR